MVGDCVSPAAGKVTAKESQMIHLLQTQFPDLPQRGALHSALNTAKFDVSGKITGGAVGIFRDSTCAYNTLLRLL